MASSAGIPYITVNSNTSVQMTRANLPLSNLLQGEILTVGVIEKMQGNQYLVNLKGVEITARSDGALAQGAKLQVQVVNTEPQLLLQVLDKASTTTDGKASGNVLPEGNDPRILIHVLGKAAKGTDALKTAAQPALQLAAGQTIDVTVGEKLQGNQYRLMVGNIAITATSDVPLQEGEKLQVKVQSLQPQIILQATDVQKQATESKINERLIQWRINPDSMTQLLNKSSEFLSNLKSVELPSGFSPKDVDVLVKVFDGIVLSNETKANPFFVKDFVEKTGLMLERNLAELAAGAPVENAKVPAENLKALLMKLSDVLLRNPLEATKIDSETAARLQNLASFATDAVKTLERGQAVNVVYQQNENGLYLQIPLALGEAYRQAEIFIRPDDKNAPASKKYASCSVDIFLDLDYLGEIAIDVGLHEGRIRCIIKCENDETRQLLDASAHKLQEALSAIGYGVGRIECVKTSDIAGQKAELIGLHVLGANDLVNSYA